MGPARQAVCAKWLAPILTAQYPKFSAWMLVGERALGLKAPGLRDPGMICWGAPDVWGPGFGVQGSSSQKLNPDGGVEEPAGGVWGGVGPGPIGRAARRVHGALVATKSARPRAIPPRWGASRAASRLTLSSAFC
jgi:hypothetical protein